MRRGLALAVGLLVALAPAVAVLCASAPALAESMAPAGGHGDGHDDDAMGPGMSPTQQTIQVSRLGWDGARDGLRLTVRQGQEVTLTFRYGDLDLDENNPHVLLVQGYDVRTATLDRDNPEVTVTFSADRAGTFTVRCIKPCTGHSNLQVGRLVVEPAAGSATGYPGSAAPRLVLGLAAAVTRQAPGAYTLVAAAADEAGTPVPDVAVTFYEETALLGTSGWAELGRAVTGTDGLARLQVSFRREGDVRVAARAMQAEARITLNVAGPLEPYHPEPTGLGVPWFNPKLIWLVAAGVWLTYAAAVHQVYVIAREGRRWTQTTAAPPGAAALPAGGAGS